MGVYLSVKCPGCNSEFENISGSKENMNMLSGTSTIVCFDCKDLQEIWTWHMKAEKTEKFDKKVPKVGNFKDRFDFIKPTDCRFSEKIKSIFNHIPHRIEFWQLGDKCPKCETIITKNDATTSMFTD